MSSGKTNIYPRFFKFFLPTITDHRLRIPEEFLKHMEGKSSGTVSLMGPSSNIWHVELIDNPDGVFLQNGWHDFVRDHSLQAGYCLVFRYEGNLHFNVQIFDTSACNKEYDTNVKPCNDCTGFGDHNKMKQGESAAKILFDSSYEASKGSFKNLMGEKNHSKIRRALKGQLAFRKPLWKIPHATTQINMEKTTVKVLPWPLQENEAVGKKALIKKHDFVSQRRPVEEEEIARAFEIAGSFKSKNRFAAVVMRKSNVYAKFVLSLPIDFVHLALSKVTKTITLYGPNRKTWMTKYIYSGYCAKLSAGWRSFAVGNNLEEYDVCVFEAITKNKLQVHIFRVVDEISPLIRQHHKRLAALRVQPNRLIEKKHQSRKGALRVLPNRLIEKHQSRKVIKPRQKAYVSHRRAVQTEEIAQALENARSFRSENYSAVVVMQKTHVYVGFCLDLPREFVNLALPKVTEAISLYGPNRKEAWKAKYIYKPERATLSAGWCSFAVGNNLEKDDVCVFEAIAHNKLRVHIFRVVDEITPLTGRCHKNSSYSESNEENV